jgi:hypothetical protein
MIVARTNNYFLQLLNSRIVPVIYRIPVDPGVRTLRERGPMI